MSHVPECTTHRRHSAPCAGCTLRRGARRRRSIAHARSSPSARLRGVREAQSVWRQRKSVGTQASACVRGDATTCGRLGKRIREGGMMVRERGVGVDSCACIACALMCRALHPAVVLIAYVCGRAVWPYVHVCLRVVCVCVCGREGGGGDDLLLGQLWHELHRARHTVPVSAQRITPTESG